MPRYGGMPSSMRNACAVRSWPERQQVERAAWAAPGVSHVTNEIVVAPATA